MIFSLKWKFFTVFIGLGLLVFVSAAIPLYIQYNNYIRRTYTNALTKALDLTAAKHPVNGAALNLFTDAAQNRTPQGDALHRDVLTSMREIAKAFDLTYIYLVQRQGSGYTFPLSTYDEPGEPVLDSWEDPPPELSTAFSSGRLVFTYAYTDEYGTFVTAFMPILEGGQVIAVWGADYSMEYIGHLRFSSLIALIIAIAISGVIAVIFAIKVSSSFTRPIYEIEQVSASLANMDFNVDIRDLRRDEVGKMQTALMQIRDSLKKSIDTLNEHLLKMAEKGRHLNSVIAESSNDLNLINKNMEIIQTEATEQTDSVARTSGAIDAIIGSIDTLNDAVYTQASHIAESSASIEQMVANTDSIRSIVKDATKATDSLSKSSSSGHSMLLKLADEVKQIQAQSTTLQSANKTISDIAARTNILAMNAAISAAHAGEAGKAFAVVAGEIRKLAEISSKESESISSEIIKIEKRITQITNVSNETVKSMGSMFNEIKAMDESFTIVNNAVEEQASGSSQILTALKTIQEMTGTVRDGTGTIHKQSDAIQRDMKILYERSEDVKKRIVDVKEASTHIADLLAQTKHISAGEYTTV